MERQHRCKLCGVEFASTQPRPYCPQGCRLPIEQETKAKDFITTIPLQSDEDVAKRKPGRPPKVETVETVAAPAPSNGAGNAPVEKKNAGGLTKASRSGTV